MLTVSELRTYIRDDDAPAEALSQIVELTNDLVDQNIGPTGDRESVEVRLIRLNVAARAWHNPAGAQSYSAGLDDWQESYRFAAGPAGAGIYLTDRERAVLAGAAPVTEWSGSASYGSGQ